MTKPLIAGVMPVHNKERFVERALRSAFAQTDPLDELIIVDDASSDASMRLVQEILRDTSGQSVRVLSRNEPGPGGYAARNLAIEAARADWIAFLDADDAWEGDHIAHARSLIASAPRDVGAVFTSRRIVRSDGSSTTQTAARETDTAPLTLDFDGFLALWRALNRCPMWTSATIIRRDVLFEAGLFPAGRCRRGGDKDTWLRAMMHSKAVASLHVGATYYLDVDDQVTRATSSNQRHCLCDTLIPMIASSSGQRRSDLQWLFNSEMQKYARWQFGNRPLARDVYRGFYASVDPLAYLTLRLISLTPLGLQRAVRDWVRR